MPEKVLPQERKTEKMQGKVITSIYIHLLDPVENFALKANKKNEFRKMFIDNKLQLVRNYLFWSFFFACSLFDLQTLTIQKIRKFLEVQKNF